MGKNLKLKKDNWFLIRFKYPYYVTITNSILNNNIRGAFFKYNENDTVSFYTNKKSYYILKNQNIIVFSNYIEKKKSFKTFFIRKFISFLSILIIILILSLNNKFIKKIVFSNECFYSKEVLDEVYNNLEKERNHYKLKKSLSEISKKLRVRFPYYEWIGLKKAGNVLYIDIIDLEPILLVQPKKQNGNLIAKKTGFIKNYHIISGVMVINTNMTVKKGDLLVSGNLNYNDEGKVEKYVSPEGYVNASTLEKQEVLIKKNEEQILYTGNKTFKTILTFKKNIDIKSPYNLYYKQCETIFKLGNFKLLKITFFEKKKYEKNIKKDDAIINAKLKIETDFYRIVRNPYEEIVKMDVINIVENATSYKIIFLVSKIENIAVFKSLSLS